MDWGCIWLFDLHLFILILQVNRMPRVLLVHFYDFGHRAYFWRQVGLIVLSSDSRPMENTKPSTAALRTVNNGRFEWSGFHLYSNIFRATGGSHDDGKWRQVAVNCCWRVAWRVKLLGACSLTMYAHTIATTVGGRIRKDFEAHCALRLQLLDIFSFTHMNDPVKLYFNDHWWFPNVVKLVVSNPRDPEPGGWPAAF
jgi:hypothetical protein